jgi:hypothetical protein
MITGKPGLFERSRQNKPMVQKRFQKILETLGIKGEPIPARELQAMAAAEGIRPGENLFSRGIIEMREE